jgi:cyclic pyranopterin phosphate synthase
VLASIDAALALGYRPVKVNVVVMRGVNDDEVPAFVELTRRRPINVRFIEFMPFDDNSWGQGSKLVGYREMVGAWLAGWLHGWLHAALPGPPAPRPPGPPGPVQGLRGPARG